MMAVHRSARSVLSLKACAWAESAIQQVSVTASSLCSEAYSLRFEDENRRVE